MERLSCSRLWLHLLLKLRSTLQSSWASQQVIFYFWSFLQANQNWTQARGVLQAVVWTPVLVCHFSSSTKTATPLASHPSSSGQIRTLCVAPMFGSYHRIFNGFMCIAWDTFSVFGQISLTTVSIVKRKALSVLALESPCHIGSVTAPQQWNWNNK